MFIEQQVQDGTAGAVALAREYVDQPVLIIFVDTIFDADLSVTKTIDADGIIWVKEVEDYQRFGVVVTDADGNMTKIVEKPNTPISKRANIGLYYIRNWKLLYEGIDWVLTQPKNKGEYYLTDAFQYMIDKGAKIQRHRRRGLVRRGEDRHAARDESRRCSRRGTRAARPTAGGLDDHGPGVHRGRRRAEGRAASALTCRSGVARSSRNRSSRTRSLARTRRSWARRSRTRSSAIGGHRKGVAAS